MSTLSVVTIYGNINKYSPTLQTRNGDKTVGTVLRHEKSGGSIVCLPDIDFYRDEFLGCVDIHAEYTMAATRLMNEANRSASLS